MSAADHYDARLAFTIQSAWFQRFAEPNTPAYAADVQVTVTRDGQLRDVSVTRSTGSDELDSVCISAVRAAAPFGPAPESLHHVYHDGIRTFTFAFEHQ